MSAELPISEIGSNGVNQAQILRAYIGPGSGLAAIGSVLAVAGAVALIVVGFVWYPVKRLLRSMKTARARRSSENP